MHVLQTERHIGTFLTDAALALAEAEDQDITVTTFRDAGVMSANAGLVLRVGNPGGPEYQITIVRSR